MTRREDAAVVVQRHVEQEHVRDHRGARRISSILGEVHQREQRDQILVVVDVREPFAEAGAEAQLEPARHAPAPAAATSRPVAPEFGNTASGMSWPASIAPTRTGSRGSRSRSRANPLPGSLGRVLEAAHARVGALDQRARQPRIAAEVEQQAQHRRATRSRRSRGGRRRSRARPRRAGRARGRPPRVAQPRGIRRTDAMAAACAARSRGTPRGALRRSRRKASPRADRGRKWSGFPEERSAAAARRRRPGVGWDRSRPRGRLLYRARGEARECALDRSRYSPWRPRSPPDLFTPSTARAPRPTLGEIPDPQPLTRFDDDARRGAAGTGRGPAHRLGLPALDAAVLARAPRLRAVVHAAGTVKRHVDARLLRARGRSHARPRRRTPLPVAEYTLAAILLRQQARLPPAAIAIARCAASAAGRTELPGARQLPQGRRHRGRVAHRPARARAAAPLRLRAPARADPFLAAAEAAALGARRLELDELLRARRRRQPARAVAARDPPPARRAPPRAAARRRDADQHRARRAGRRRRARAPSSSRAASTP